MVHPISLYFSEQFVISAGCVLFKFPGPCNTQEKQIQVCLLHQRVKDEWHLPKGRKDLSEPLLETALRETFEETGYHASVLPVRMDTRAHPANAVTSDVAETVENVTEPFAITVRHIAERNVKMIWWFVAKVEEGHERQEGTQMANEDFEAHFFGIDEALGKVTYPEDTEVVRRATQLVKDTYEGVLEEQERARRALEP